MLSVEYKRTAFEFSLIAADTVVTSFNDLMQCVYRQGADGKSDAKELMRLWAAFLVELRRNVGDPNTKLSPADMLRGQVKDIDRVIG